MSLVVLNSEAIDSCIRSMAASICAREGDMPIAIVGIRRGGEHLAQRLAREVEKVSGTLPPLGMVDITLYRDDGFGRSEFPEVGVTDLPFDIKTHTVILIDDVLYTGRTVRAAMDAVLDYGRPKAIRLVVLVDRGLHELPIRADIIGHKLQTDVTDHIDVQFVEAGAAVDQVVSHVKKLAGGGVES